ncbi:MAG: TIGR03086 family metal-binding protein [Acidimicrobiales bacterium]
MDIVDALDQTFRHAHQIIGGVRPDQYEEKTPCDEWSVRDLLEHMIGVVAGLGAAAAGAPPEAFVLGTDPAAQFEQAAASALIGWRTPGVLDRVVDAGPGPMPGRVLAGINLLDTATHTWDLATATGQPARLPDDVASAALEASLATISTELRPGRFAPELTAEPGAGPTDRLVAFLGRRP